MANYPIPYQNTWGYSGSVGQQMYPTFPGQSMTAQNVGQQTVGQSQQGGPGLIWVDGEVGAKAYQLPANWPCNQPVALWDTNDTVIYLKSINPMGMPNPLQKAHYTLEEYKGTGPARSGAYCESGDSGKKEKDMSDYVRKEDLERLKQDLMDTIGTMNRNGTGVNRKPENKVG